MTCLADVLPSHKAINHRGQILANKAGQVDMEVDLTMEEMRGEGTAKDLHKAILHSLDTIRDHHHQDKDRKECQYQCREAQDPRHQAQQGRLSWLRALTRSSS